MKAELEVYDETYGANHIQPVYVNERNVDHCVLPMRNSAPLDAMEKEM